MTEEARSNGSWGLFHKESIEGVEVYRAKGTRFKKAGFIGRFANYLSYFLSALYVGMRVPRADIVVSLTDPPIIGLAALAAARKSKAKYVFLCQDIFPEVATLLEDFQSPAVNRALQWTNRFLLTKADRVIALGETMRERLVETKGAEPQKTRVIHNWADCSAIQPGQKENAFSHAHGLARAFVVMHSGNVGLSQNLDVLIEAAERLEEHQDVNFVIVGDGVKRPDLEAKATKLTNVKFLPFQPKSGLNESFATADVFVISLKPGLSGFIVPSKLYGILAAGKPYVASVEPECEAAIIARQFDCGLIAEPGNAHDLAQKILQLFRDRELAQRLGNNARRAGLQFDRHRQVGAYHELFRELTLATPSRSRKPSMFLKRAFDVLLSGMGLLGSSPLWAVISAAIKLEDGGPVFFGQTRVGLAGRLFKSWKFRSMVPDADKKFGPVQAQERDPRVTRAGKLLRATAMDELPQLWNIFKGDMSFVGPRALASQEIELDGTGECVALEDIPGFEKRHQVRPGLTGIAQVYASRDIPRRSKFRYDLLYVEKQNFCLDMRLIALSFWITFRGKWESRDRKF
jgi:lipopolysaccharide/colanic/teichoic acid biosynthesis glycosyltransferase